MHAPMRISAQSFACRQASKVASIVLPSCVTGTRCSTSSRPTAIPAGSPWRVTAAARQPSRSKERMWLASSTSHARLVKCSP